ncbi:hypothetical protein AC056_18235 [Acinetobacter genomosp. 33YU]|uniref:hypothetical protein n=1 Tax=Acinetobacter TaxID=469 RepID=UPI00097FA500|nr:hypothetical protein [Acinetobacter genomosp. 33YU]ONN47880.1 hypothetical protein AC056_18235 [Acinetobacter genomosp. 33YU]PVA03266.1 hypothetical protein DC362_10090 [Acinetobacter nosocomialis]
MKDQHDNKTIDAFKSQPKSVSERQRAYRDKDSLRRLDMQIDSVIFSELSVLVSHGNETKKQLIERLIHEQFLSLVNSDNFDVNKV